MFLTYLVPVAVILLVLFLALGYLQAPPATGFPSWKEWISSPCR